MQSQLEKYLSQIEKQLAALPTEQRQEELREIRSHLEMMIDENISRGCDADEAIAKAIEQFGAAASVGFDLRNSPASEPKRRRNFSTRVYGFIAIYVLVNAILLWLWTSGILSPDFPFSFLRECSFLMLAFIFGWNIEKFGFAPKKLLRNVILAFFVTCGGLILLSFVLHDTTGNLKTILFLTSWFAGMCISRLLRYLIGDNSNAKSA